METWFGRCFAFTSRFHLPPCAEDTSCYFDFSSCTKIKESSVNVTALSRNVSFLNSKPWWLQPAPAAPARSAPPSPLASLIWQSASECQDFLHPSPFLRSFSPKDEETVELKAKFLFLCDRSCRCVSPELLTERWKPVQISLLLQFFQLCRHKDGNVAEASGRTGRAARHQLTCGHTSSHTAVHHNSPHFWPRWCRFLWQLHLYWSTLGRKETGP